MKKILPRQPILHKLQEFIKRINRNLIDHQWTLYYSDAEKIILTYNFGKFYLTGSIKVERDIYNFYYALANSVANLKTFYIIINRLEDNIDESALRYNFPEKGDLDEFIQILRDLYYEPLTKKALS